MAMTSMYENYTLAKAYGRSHSFAPPATVWLALFRGDPTNAGLTTSEVSGGGYARINLTTLLHDPTNGYIRNLTDIVFAVASGNWGDITHMGVMSSSSAGQMINYSSLGATVNIANTEQFKVGASLYVMQAL